MHSSVIVSLYCCFPILVLEEVLDGFIGNHLLIERVRTVFGILDHLDYLGI